jgi:hypothetical protein
MGRLAQLVGYLGWLVGCYYALLVALKSWKRSKPMLTRRWSIFASSLKSSKGDVGKGAVRPHMPIITFDQKCKPNKVKKMKTLLLLAFLLAATWLAADGTPQCRPCGNSICCIDPPGTK